MNVTRGSILFVLIAIGASGCGTLSQSSPGNCDYLLGWYELEDRDVIIPVFKAEGDYYTVMRGAEIPLKPCPEGLVVSTSGTTIIYDKQASSPYYISILDGELAHHTNQEWGTGKKRSLTRIDAPTWLPDPTTEHPHSVDDFLGWYVSAWMPAAGIEIRKDGEKYLATQQYMVEPGKWEPAGHPSKVAIVPLPDRLGFSILDRDLNDANLVYCPARKRYEMTIRVEDESTTIARIPLARVGPEVLSRIDAIPSPPMAIGIPCWH